MSSPGAMAATLPWESAKVLDEHLRDGKLNLATAIGQFGAVVRETLKVMESHANDNIQHNLDRKGKLERLEKLVNDLSEKCQGMQQALLYKEEKYDEKCREVERYKVICELSAKQATNEDMYYTPEVDMNNNRDDENCDAPSTSRSNMSDHLEGNANNRVEPWCYMGGPSKRKPDARFQQRLEGMGGINVKGATTHTGPVPIERLYRPDARIKIAVGGQSNEVVGGSIVSQQTPKRLFAQSSLRQASTPGIYTRYPNRRKKMWPY